MRMSPWCGVAVATRPQHGDIDDESERTGTIDGDGGREEKRADAPAGRGADGGGLPPEPAHLAALSGRGRRGPGASAARHTQRATQAARPPRASAGPLRRGTLRRLWPHAHGRTVVER